MLLNTFTWLSYGLFMANPYLVVSNLPGMPLSLWYVLSTQPFLDQRSQQRNLHVLVSGIWIISLSWMPLFFAAPLFCRGLSPQ
jgi:hypothetical protein